MSEQNPTQAQPVDALAFVALACSLLSIAGCVLTVLLSLLLGPSIAIAVLVMPIPAILGIAVGGVFLFRARGRDSGVRPFAVAAVILGIVAVVLPGATIIGAVRTYMPVQKRVVPIVEAAARASEAGDLELAIKVLDKSVRGIGGDRILPLFAEARRACGGSVEAGLGLGGAMRSHQALRDILSGADSLIGVTEFYPKPVELRGPGGAVSAWVLLDEKALARDKVRITDMMVLLSADRCAVLLPEGRFSLLADQAGLEVVEFAEP